jgi:hypothetical protein
MLYSSLDTSVAESAEPTDANSYLPFKVVDASLIKQIQSEFESMGTGTEQEVEGDLSHFQ